MRVLRALGYLWSAPYGVLGLLAALVFRALGWRKSWRWDDGALLLTAQGPLADRLRSSGWGAFTLGWVVFLWTPVPSESLVRHERRHVHQALVLGPLFPILYLGLLVLALAAALPGVLAAPIIARSSIPAAARRALLAAYREHPLEVDAWLAVGRAQLPRSRHEQAQP